MFTRPKSWAAVKPISDPWNRWQSIADFDSIVTSHTPRTFRDVPPPYGMIRGPLWRTNVDLRIVAYVASSITFTEAPVSIIILAFMLLNRIFVMGDFRAAALFLGSCLLTRNILPRWNSAYLDRSGAPAYLSAFSLCILFRSGLAWDKSCKFAPLQDTFHYDRCLPSQYWQRCHRARPFAQKRSIRSTSQEIMHHGAKTNKANMTHRIDRQTALLCDLACSAYMICPF